MITLEELLNDMDDKPMRTQIRNCLFKRGIHTTEQLLKLSEFDLYVRTKNFGKRSLSLLKQQLAKHGLKLNDRD